MSKWKKKKKQNSFPVKVNNLLKKTDMPFLPPWWAKINVVNCLLAENE